jgi:hypothetical protein
MNWGWDWIGRDAAVYAREKLKKRRAGGLPSQATIFAVRMPDACCLKTSVYIIYRGTGEKEGLMHQPFD